LNREEEDNLFATFRQTIDSIILDKRKYQKNEKLLNNFNANINLGLQMGEDLYLWVNLLAKNGNYSLNKGKLDEYDLELMAEPIDLLYFSSGDNSIISMLTKKNSFGKRKLKISKSSDGKRNLGLLLKISKILVLD
jgi:hypothetical protein